MKPMHFREHLLTKHPGLKDKPLDFGPRKCDGLKHFESTFKKKPLYRARLHVTIVATQYWQAACTRRGLLESYTCCHFQITLCHSA